MTALSLVLLVAAAPIADDPNYQQAIALYEAVEFEQALFRVQSVAVRTDLNPAERAELFFWMGLCYGNIGELETARRHFVDGLAIFPDAPLPQPNTSPLIIDVFKEAKAKVADSAPDPTTGAPAQPSSSPTPVGGASPPRRPRPRRTVACPGCSSAVGRWPERGRC